MAILVVLVKKEFPVCLVQKIFGFKFFFIVLVPTTMPAPTTTPEGKNW